MGKFIETTEKQFINEYVKSYMTATNEYSVYQEGSPTFVTYYSVDKRASTEDMGLGSVIEIVGSESPIKYNKIENFPIYSMEEMNPSIDYDEPSGLNTEINGSALILPKTIVPSPEDLFLISYNDIKTLYRVDNIEMSSYSNKEFYKISFSKELYSLDLLEERQLSSIFSVVYENIGTEYNSVIEKVDCLLLDHIDTLYKELCSKYIKYFYNKKLGTFILNEDKCNSAFKECYKDNNIYDPKLCYFINNNSLFLEKRTFLKNIYIESLLKDRDFDYERTIYSFLENKEDIDYFLYSSIYLNLIKESIFKLYQEKYYEVVHNIGNNILNKQDIFECDFKNIIKNYTKAEDLENINIIEKVIIIFLKEEKLDNRYLIGLCNDIKILGNFHSYMLIPCILYILNQVKIKIFIS